MKTKIFTLLLAVAASIGTMFAESGTCGGNLTWDLTNGVLTISGTGAMNNYDYDVAPWYDYCENISQVVINDGVTSIGFGAFWGCSVLTSVTIPNSVTSIVDFAFRGCSGLTSVTIPNSVTSIGDWAFSGCSGLTSIKVENGNTNYDSREDCNAIIKTATNTLIAGCQNTIIPNSVTSIGDGAFYGCIGLTSITILNSVTSIGDWAFSGCSGLTSIIVESGNTVYDSRNNCNAIIETATNTLIAGCQSTIIPNSVTSIGDGAFYGCIGLTSITIPNSVTSIGESAFSGCSGLTSITIPNSVTSIGYEAFYSCTGLNSVTIEAEAPSELKQEKYGLSGSGKNAFMDTNDCPIYVPCGTLDAYKTAWSKYASRIKYGPLKYHITRNVNIEGSGSVQLPQSECEDTIITAVPNYGYHFVRWNDGNTDNPRTIILASDTTFTAEFAKNTYSISTTSANPEWGTTAGGKSALYLDEVEISATANYGYHFVKWNDNNTANPRTISVTEDKTYTATFAKNVYSITKNAEHGSISGNSSAEYLDFVTLTVNADYGYHFTQWSDGLKDNPRIFQITKDTTFTAEFAYDRVGTCGKDLALIWSYDPTNKVLTIGNAGEFTENMRFGVEAPTEMRELVVGNNVTAIGAGAFAGIKTLSKVTVGDAVKTIGEQAFYDCTGLTHITCYRERPCVAYSNTFDGIDKFDCTLHVLSASVDMYKAATGWRDFYYIETIDAATTTLSSDDVTVEPSVNTATVSWPTQDNAATYTIQITKDGEVFCTLIFNANGQLTGIAFAPSRDGQSQVPQAILTGNGMQFTVTGLNSATHYGISLFSKDNSDNVLASFTGEFTTTSADAPQGIDNTPFPSGEGWGEASKLILHNGQIYILRGDKVYTVEGQLVR